MTQTNYFRAEIARLDPENDDENHYAEVYTFNLLNDINLFSTDNSIFMDEYINAANFKLEPYDLVFLKKDPYFVQQEIVTISGYVYYPGDYVLKGPKETLSDVIKRAGGLRPEAYPRSSELIRDSILVNIAFDKAINNPSSKYNIFLQQNDRINIKARPNMVYIEGAVNSPGNYQFIEGMRLNDYIKYAGGFTREASRASTFIKYPNGISKKLSYFPISPYVYDGSTITVGTKADVEKFSFTQYVTNLTSIYADFMQAYMMVVLLGQQ
jgi:Periplasmic protein involved in polysaccharide export